MRAAINKANTLRGLVTFGFIRNITSMSSSSQSFVSRSVIKKVFAKLQSEGDGAVVRRGISRFSNLSTLGNINDDQRLISSEVSVVV